MGTDTPTEIQARVEQWVVGEFGPQTLYNVKEQAARLLEETLEYCQAVGLSRWDAARQLRWTYARPIGVPEAELGGVFITSLGCASSLNARRTDIEESTLLLIESKPAGFFAKRQLLKTEGLVFQTPGFKHQDFRGVIINNLMFVVVDGRPEWRACVPTKVGRSFTCPLPVIAETERIAYYNGVVFIFTGRSNTFRERRYNYVIKKTTHSHSVWCTIAVTRFVVGSDNKIELTAFTSDSDVFTSPSQAEAEAVKDRLEEADRESDNLWNRFLSDVQPANPSIALTTAPH